jgi:hypothetical protein
MNARTHDTRASSPALRYVVTWLLFSVIAGCALQPLPGFPRPATKGQPYPARYTGDAPDDTSDQYVVHAIYFVPHDALDRGFDTLGILATSIRNLNDFLAEQTGGYRLRIDNSGGRPDITFFPSRHIAGVKSGHPGLPYDSIVAELQRAGFTSPRKIYAIFVAGPPPSGRICGMAHRPGSYAVVWMQECGYPSPGRYSMLRRRIWQVFYAPTGHPWRSGALNYVDRSMLHEIVHSLGHVTPLSGSRAQGGHVTCSFWTKYFGGKGDLMQNCGGGMRIDRARQFYFQHSRSGCPDLARSVFLTPLPNSPELPPLPVHHSQLIGISGNLRPGQRLQLEVMPYDSSEHLVTCLPSPKWSIDNPAVATITARGELTVHSVGRGTIIVDFGNSRVLFPFSSVP